MADEPAFSTAAPAPMARALGMPSSVTSTTSGTASPTFTSMRRGPCTSSTGGVLARTSGLLLPAPSAPVSDAFTTSSIL